MIINNNIYIYIFLNLDVKSVIQKVGSGRMSPIRAHTMKDLEQVSKKKSKRGYPLFYQVSVINNTMSRRYIIKTHPETIASIEVPSVEPGRFQMRPMTSSLH